MANKKNTESKVDNTKMTVVEVAKKTATPIQSPIGDTTSDRENKLRLKQCEDTIRQNESGAFAIGNSLNTINKDSLYKVAGYNSFDDYCVAKWDVSAKYAYRLMKAAECRDVLSEHDGEKGWMLPRTESQIRPLTKLPQNAWVESWRKVLEALKGKSMTAEAIEAVLNPTPDVGTTTTEEVAPDPDAENEDVKDDKETLGKIAKLLKEARLRLKASKAPTVKEYQEILNAIEALLN